MKHRENVPPDTTLLTTRVSCWPDALDESKMAPVKHRPMAGVMAVNTPRYAHVDTPVGTVVNPIGLPPGSCVRPIGSTPWAQEQEARDLEQVAKIFAKYRRR